MKYLIALILLLGLVACDVGDPKKVRLGNEIVFPWGEGLQVVIEEGRSEPRSLGSYSVRLYQTTDEDNDRDFFITGLIFARDGFLKHAELVDIDDDQQEDLVVIFESAGSGSYLTAHAWRFLDDKLSSIAIVEGLSPGSNVQAALTAQIQALNALQPEAALPESEAGAE